LDGLFVGMLDDEELAVFRQAVIGGLARVSYSGYAGLLGLGRVRVMDTPELAARVVEAVNKER
jgi:hypothetical protein